MFVLLKFVLIKTSIKYFTSSSFCIRCKKNNKNNQIQRIKNVTNILNDLTTLSPQRIQFLFQSIKRSVLGNIKQFLLLTISQVYCVHISSMKVCYNTKKFCSNKSFDDRKKKEATRLIRIIFLFSNVCFVRHPKGGSRHKNLCVTRVLGFLIGYFSNYYTCLLYTSPSPRDKRQSRMPSSA